MPIQEDIRDHGTIGPMLRQAQMEGQRELLMGLIAERFGAIPPGMRQQLTSLDPEGIKVTGQRLLRAQRIEDLFTR